MKTFSDFVQYHSNEVKVVCRYEYTGKAWSDRVDWCSISNNVDTGPNSCSEDGAELEGEALNLQVSLCSNPHLSSPQALGSDQNNEVCRAVGLNVGQTEHAAEIMYLIWPGSASRSSRRSWKMLLVQTCTNMYKQHTNTSILDEWWHYDLLFANKLA